MNDGSSEEYNWNMAAVIFTRRDVARNGISFATEIALDIST